MSAIGGKAGKHVLNLRFYRLSCPPSEAGASEIFRPVGPSPSSSSLVWTDRLRLPRTACQGEAHMARMFVDCRDYPSEMNCTVAISADTKNELFRSSRSARGSRAWSSRQFRIAPGVGQDDQDPISRFTSHILRVLQNGAGRRIACPIKLRNCLRAAYFRAPHKLWRRLMTAFNVVRFRVKPGRNRSFWIPQDNWDKLGTPGARQHY